MQVAWQARDKRVVQSPALWLLSNLNIICIWQFHCPLEHLQMAAQPSTEVSSTVADQSHVKSKDKSKGLDVAFWTQKAQQDLRTHMGKIKARL